ncbi:acyltransferase family protein [Lactovum odontotermitis]
MTEIQENRKNSSTRIRFFSYVRALGLLLVLLYHFYPKIMPGGFIGVDIFFTFSGYLITSLIIVEFRRSESFNLKKFAERRFFRIFPTLFFAMLVTLPLTLLGSPDLRYQLRQQVLAGLSFVSNLYESSTGISYENSFAPHMFVHLWSLGIEIQFYVVWALILWLLLRFSKRAFRSKIFLLSLVIALFSAISMLVTSLGTSNYSGIYYSPILHIFPFFIGATLAGVVGISESKFIRLFAKNHSVAYLRNASLIFGGILVILSLVLHYDWKITFMFGFLLAGLATAALIFFLRMMHEKTLPTQSCEPKIVQGISDISYGVYIFHWALLVIFLNLRIPHLPAVLLTIVLSFALSALMFYVLDPILHGKIPVSQPLKQAIAAVSVVLLIPSAAAVAMSTSSTTVSNTLWQGATAQASQGLYLSERIIETGAAGANTLLIGDSVANGTRTSFSGAVTLEGEIPTIFGDTAGDRKISSDLLPDLSNDLGMMPANCAIVIALGTNSTVPETDISILKSVIKQYSDNHQIVLVTPANFSAGGPFNSDKIADWELSIKNKYKNVAIADWRAAASGHPEYYDPDGIHISDRPEGRKVWIDLVKAALAK